MKGRDGRIRPAAPRPRAVAPDGGIATRIHPSRGGDAARGELVERLRAAVVNGTYRPDARAVARAILLAGSP